MSKFFSIAITTYEMNGKGVEYLNFSLSMLKNQTFQDFEVVVSDNSKDDNIKIICDMWKSHIDIKYFKNDVDKLDSPSANINNAISKCTGQYIKILFLDDFLNNIDGLKILNEFIIQNNCIWMANACNHTQDCRNLYSKFVPFWNDDIHLGKNSLGSPSVLCIKNIEDKILFDENLSWLMDCDYYKKYYLKYGEPSIMDNDIVTIRISANQLTNKLSEERKNNEYPILSERYK